MIELDRDDKKQLFEMLIPLQGLADERGRKAMFVKANLERFLAQFDLTGPSQTVIPLLINHLCTLDQIVQNQTALGYFFDAIIHDAVGKAVQDFLTALIRKYNLLPDGDPLQSPPPPSVSIPLEAIHRGDFRQIGLKNGRKIGEGGFSVVYKAVDMHTNAVKALKIPKGSHDLRPEHLLLEGLQEHPGIVPVERSLPVNDCTWLVMPYAGRTLKWHIEQKTIQPHHLDQILIWMKSLLEVLIFAHENGIIHKDIKPSNILIDEQDKHLRVTDFGIAQKIQYAEFKHSTIVRGTICYMSPEQQKAEEITQQTDIYSFGAVFYELVTGEKPVGRCPDPTDYNPDLPAALETLITRCLEPKLNRRYKTAQEVLSELSEVGNQVMLPNQTYDLSEPYGPIRVIIQANSPETENSGSSVNIEEDVPIIILREEEIVDRPEENPKKIVEEIIDKLHEIEPLKDSQIVEQIDGHIQNRRYYKALQLLNTKPSFAVLDGEHYRQSTVWQCLNTMPPIDIVRFFFEMIAPGGRKDLGLEWQSEDPPEGRLTVTEASLQEHLKISPVPVRVYNHLRENHIEECYTYVSGHMNAPEIPVLVFRETSDEFPVGLRMLQYREAGQPVVRFIQFKLSALKKRIADRTGLDYFREQILAHYRKVDDLYSEGLTRNVFQDGEFFGRIALIEDLIAHIHSGEKFFISGLRRSGKTSLLRRLQLVNHLPDHLMVHVSFDRMGHVPKDKLNEVYLFLLRQIKTALQEKYPTDKYPRKQYPMLDFDRVKVFGFDSKTSLQTIIRHFVEDLDRLLSEIQAEDDLHFRKLILLMDEIDRLLPDSTRKENADGVEQSEAFLAQLRDLSNSHNEVVSVGMVGFGPVLTLLRDYESPIYDQFEEKLLSMLTREECDELVTTIGSRMLVFYPPESLETIFRATGGDPQITRYLCSAIFQRRGRKPGSVEVEEAQNGITKFLKSAKYRTRVANIFQRFEPYFRVEAEILRKIACTTDVAASMTFSEITELHSSESLEVYLGNLCDYGLLRQVEEDHYTVGMGLLHRWLRQEYGKAA